MAAQLYLRRGTSELRPVRCTKSQKEGLALLFFLDAAFFSDAAFLFNGEQANNYYPENVIATVHPSSILRADDETREQEYRELVRDLEKVAKFI